MMGEVLVSISCITYNHVKYIRQCLDGFLMQKSDFRYEVLIHDDASNDGTSEIISEYERLYPEIIKPIIQKENQYSKGKKGFNATYNFSRAKGKYIAMCEGDDYWTDPFKLQKQVDFLESHSEYSLCVGGFEAREESAIKGVPIIKRLSKNDFPNGYSFTLEDTKGAWITKTLTALFRNHPDIASKIVAYKFARDIHLFYHLLKKGKGFYITEILGVYNVHDGGVFSSSKLHVQNFVHHYQIYKELYEVNADEFSRRMYLIQILRMLNLKLSGHLEVYEIKFVPLVRKSFQLLNSFREMLSLLKALSIPLLNKIRLQVGKFN